MKTLSTLLLFFTISFSSFGQTIDPFSVRHQENQKGGLTMLANVSVGCNCADHNETPPGGTSDNNGVSSNFVDIDADASTFMSSADQLNLASCSEITWAGLYWEGKLDNQPNTTPNWANRDQVKLSIDGAGYIDLTADELLDNSVGKETYFCFKDITALVQANTITSSYTVANVVTETGSNTFGGWTIVVVYGNIYETMKNLTVFDGLSNVSPGASGTVDIPLSGFLTPPSGAVNFELGVVAHDGDRGQSGDQLSFNGAGAFVNISDAIHPVNNVFNSTISQNGVLTAFRNPSYNNNLGHDANIYSPNNATFNYIGNAATNATIRISTQSETVLTSVITSAIDIYEPDLRASVTYSDLNAGTVEPGDILEYTIVAKNIGSDISLGTFLTDTLDQRLVYIPNSLSIDFGPNTGPKTDPIDTDQGEFILADNVVRVRIGTGADGTTGGQVINSPTGADSTVITFQVQLPTECAIWQCGPILENKAFVFGTGQISGITNGNNGASDLLDLNGCPSLESGIVTVDVSNCPDTVITHTDSLCVGELLSLSFPNSTFLDFTWTGPNGFTSTGNNPTIPNVQLFHAGDYVLHVSYLGVECITDTTAPVFVSDNPTLQLNTLQDDTCFNLGQGFINVSGVGNAPFTYQWSNSDMDSLAGNLNAGTYNVIVTDQYGCTVADTFSITEPTLLEATASILSDYNGQDISCNGAMDGSATVVTTGGVVPYTYLWTPTLLATDTINGLDAGVHVITVTDDNGCIVEDSVTITQPDSLIVTAAITDVLCFGDSTGVIDVSVTGGTPGYIYSWSNGELVQDLLNVPSGVYIDTVVDINGCSDTVSFTIDQPPVGMAMTSVVTDILCFGDSTGSVQLFVTGGVMPYTYNWSNGDIDSLAGNLPAGTYTVGVTDQNGCALFQSFTLTENPIIAPTTAITSDYNGQDISCFNAMDGSAQVTVTGGVQPYSYFWSPGGQITDSIVNLDAGTHIVVVTDSNGCQMTDSITLVQPDTISITAVITDILCFADTVGSIDVTITGGTNPYTYSWSNGILTEDQINLSAGIYTDTVTDINGCFNFVDFTINQPTDSMTVTANTTENLCSGDSTGTIDLTVIGGIAPYTYIWSTGDTIPDLIDLPQGGYTVTVTDSNNCTQTLVVTVYTPPALALTETHLNPFCQSGTQGSIDLSVAGGTPGYSYSWNNGDTIQDIANLNAGVYFVTVTDTNNCMDTLSITITDPDAILISEVHTDVLCYGDSTGAIDISLSNGTPGFAYTWSTTDSTQDISNIPAGAYYVDVVDTNGCGGFMSFIIAEPDTALHFTSTSVTDILCYNDSIGAIDIEVDGGETPYTYQWDNTEITQDIQNLPAGIYTVVVTDSNMCQITYIDTVFQPTELILTETHVNILCFGDSTASIDVTTIGGVQPYTYLWNTADTTEDLTGIPFGTYDLVATDSNGCVDTISVVIDQPTAPLSLSTSLTHVLCAGGNNGAIDLTVLGGTAGYTYLWNTTDIIQDLNTLIAGPYNVVVTDTNGCIDTASVQILEPTPLVISGTLTPTCFGDSIGAIDVTVSGGVLPYTYLWDNAAITEDIQNLLPGIYNLVVTDSNGCQITYTDTVLAPSNIVLSETHVDVLCFGASTGSIDLTALGGVMPYTYLWNNASPNEDLTNIPAGTYSVLVTDASNCTDTISALITQPFAPINLSSIVIPVLCFGDDNGSIDLSVSGGTPGYSYSWNTGDTLQNIDTLTAGSYTVTVTDINNCVQTLNSIVSGPMEPLTLDTYSTPICFGDTTGIAYVDAFGGTPGYTYVWNTGSPNNVDSLMNLGVGSYSVMVTDANGCTAVAYEDVQIVNELAGCVVIYMPNVFTPNGDFINDIFLPVDILSIKDFNIIILNRWGNVMYESVNFTEGWDGLTPRGAEANDGVYFWKIVYEDVYGKSGEKHGNVTLIRE
jgi:gliding motility-associated-like protein/uncharacterized repeat protein (TIGR01451 family)